MKISFIHKPVCGLLLIALFFCGYASAQIKTVVPAEIIGVINPTTTTSVDIHFNLSALPANCNITACQLQLTCKGDPGNLSPELNLLSETDKRIFTFTLKPSQTANTTVIYLKIGAAYLPQSGNANYVLRLKLDHSIPVGATFYPASGQKGENQAFAPRLIVSYTYRDEKPVAVTDWASTYSNYQHNSQTPVAIKGALPTRFEKIAVGGLGEVPQNLVMYRDHIYAVGTNGPNLYSVDLATLRATVISSAIAGNLTASTPVIDPFGRFYHAADNSFAVTNLANNQYSGTKATPGVINNALTTGPDGSLYVPCDNSMSAYTPYPRNVLMWDIYKPGKKSAITLNKAGTTAYVLVDSAEKKARLIALNANTGKIIRTVEIDVETPRDGDEYLPTPVVDDNGNVYIANRVVGARHLFIFGEELKDRKQDITSPCYVSMPAAITDNFGKATGMFYINDDRLYKYDANRNEIAEVCRVEGDVKNAVRSLITDQANNIYYARLGDDALYYKAAASNTITRIDIGVNFGKNLVIGVDGALYTGTGAGIVAIKPVSYDGNYELKSNIDDQNPNNLSFAAQELTIQNGFVFSNYKYLKAINGISFSGKATLTNNADVLLKIGNGGKGVTFNKDFTVAKGAVLQVKTGN